MKQAFSTGIIIILFAAAIVAAATEAVSFSSANYTEVFCGAALPVLRPAEPVVLPQHNGPVTVDVGISSFAFTPPDVTINVGDTVRWTNNGGLHTTTSDTAIWNSGNLTNGQTFSFTFTSPGMFPYHCNIHLSMTANVTVLGGSTPTDTPTNTATNTPTAAPTCVPPPSGMISWWQGQGNANDLLGLNNGVNAGATTFVSGMVGQAFHFDGTTNSYISIPDSPSLTPASNQLTIDAWIKPNFGVANSFDTIFKKRSGCSSVIPYSLSVEKPSGGVYFTVATNTFLSTSPVPNDGNFHHVAGTYDGTIMIVYIDGVQAGTLNIGAVVIPTVSDPAFIGKHAACGQIAAADIDEVDFFSRGLSQSEIQDIYNAGSAGKCIPVFTPTNTPTPASPPTLGNYPNTTVDLGDNVTITPDVAPTNTTSISVETATGFVGELTADPLTGVVRVTNAHHANIIPGSYAVTVRAFGPGGMTLTTFSLTVTNGTACTETSSFTSPAVPEFTVGGRAGSVAIGDFNSDGIQDIATANYIPDNVSIRLGNGSGGFTSPATPEITAGSFPNSVAIGDFNGDGIQDLAVANFLSDNVSIRLGDGSGGFTSPAVPEVPVGLHPVPVAIGDFNGDGRRDFAVINRDSDTVSIRLGDGSGGFTSPAVAEVPVASFPVFIAIGDFNDDGIEDFAAVNNISNNVSIRLGNGNGGFTSPVVPEVTVVPRPQSVAIGDFNNDGLQDFATANQGGSFGVNQGVSIRLGDGAGGFVSPTTPEVLLDRTPHIVVIGDFNRDGNQDFATTSSYSSPPFSVVTTRLGNGSGGFISPVVPEVAVAGINNIAIGDFNGDGMQDFITASDSSGVSIRMGACSFNISGIITYGNAIGNPVPPRFVKNVSLSSTSGAPGVGPVITGTPGTYLLTGFGSGSYTIKPTKPGGSTTAITSNDAARIAQGVTGSLPFVSQNQRFAADVTGNGNVSSGDAAKVAQFVAGLPFSPPNLTGQWKFFTTGAPSPLPTPPQVYDDSRTYASVTSNLTGEDYVGILVGEASGNYNPATHPRAVNSGQWTVDSEDGGARGMPITVSGEQVVTEAEKEIVIPVNVQGLVGKEIISYEFDLRYDPAVIQPLKDPVDVAGTVSRGLTVVTNPYEPGLLRVVVYGPMPIDEDGLLLNLRFTAVGSAGSTSLLTFERIMFNEGESQMSVFDGQVELF